MNARSDKKVLTAIEIKKMTTPGRYFEGMVKGLMIVVAPNGSKNWILRTTVSAKRVDIGIGGYPTIGLSVARELATNIRQDIKKGIDPIAVKRKQVETLKTEREAQQLKGNQKTFTEVAREAFKMKRHEWRSVKHGKQWWATIENHVIPYIGARPIDELTQTDIKDVLERIWLSHPETAQRLQQRIKFIFDYAQVALYPKSNNNYYPQERKNPAVTAVMLLPKISKSERVVEFRSLDYNEIGTFMQALRASSYHYKSALEFLILTCVRSGDVRGAKWGEINFEKQMWTIPADRLKIKSNGAHRVPLPASALQVLNSQLNIRSNSPKENEYIFPNTKDGQINDDALNNIIRKLGYAAKTVPHGFRACFKTWATETTNYPYIVSERALAHGNADDDNKRDRLGNSYQRGDLFQKRIELMNDWAEFINASPI